MTSLLLQTTDRFRIEHQVDGLAPLILRCFPDLTEAFAALRLEARRLSAEGAAGRVMLIDQHGTPETELAWYAVYAQMPLI